MCMWLDLACLALPACMGAGCTTMDDDDDDDDEEGEMSEVSGLGEWAGSSVVRCAGRWVIDLR
jgi:hypothetical protein